MLVDPCIIVQFLQWKTQQDATVYQNSIIPYFKWSSTCFGGHTAHHQESKTAQAASGFAYMEGCRTCSCWTLSRSVYAGLHVRQPSMYAKPEVACAVLGSWWWAVCHQEPKTSSVYATWQRPTTARPTTFHVCKTRGCLCSFRLLMMDGVIRSLKLVAYALPDSVQQLNVRQPSTYAKPEVACAVLGSWWWTVSSGAWN